MAWRAHQRLIAHDAADVLNTPKPKRPITARGSICSVASSSLRRLSSRLIPIPVLSRQVVWLPEGDWYHVFTGEYYEGDRWHAIYGALHAIFRCLPKLARFCL